MTLVILRGLPASGKSTWAKEWVAENPGQRIRINRDDIREQFFQTPTYEYVQEEAVTLAEHAMVTALLKSGKDVIIDDTNLRAKYVKPFMKIAKKVGVEYEVQDFEIPVDEAIARDVARLASNNYVGETIIRRMAERYLHKGRLRPVPELDADASHGERYLPNPCLPPAILVDIDGTVATHPDRGHHEYERVSEDLPNWPVIKNIQAMRRAGYKLVFLSGRPDWCKEETKQWLRKHVQGFFHGPYMRQTGDNRNDAVVKVELFDQNVRHNFQIIATFDDRDRVVKAWRDMGLTCLQVNYGDF